MCAGYHVARMLSVPSSSDRYAEMFGGRVTPRVPSSLEMPFLPARGKSRSEMPDEYLFEGGYSDYYYARISPAFVTRRAPGEPVGAAACTQRQTCHAQKTRRCYSVLRLLCYQWYTINEYKKERK